MQSMGVIVLTMGNRAKYGGNRAKIVFGALNHSNSRGLRKAVFKKTNKTIPNTMKTNKIKINIK